jgi:tetratricopeptide (TPR) repeat protein
MMTVSTSFWADIKKYEDVLAKDPASYCFAPLSELYRKLGLLEDAVAVARAGTSAHPEYIGGYMALGRALFEKKEFVDSRICLEKVARATPENLLAQKLLSLIYQEDGNIAAAQHALEILISFSPDDMESRQLLDSLREKESTGDNVVCAVHQTNEEWRNCGSLTMDQNSTATTEAFDTETISCDSGETLNTISFDDHDSDSIDEMSCMQPAPVHTITLAELYESQGFFDNALLVYSELLRKDPGNLLLIDRIEKLKNIVDGVAGAEKPSLVFAVAEDSSLLATAPFCDKFLENVKDGRREEVILEALEAFLDSIKRRRECLLKVY